MDVYYYCIVTRLYRQGSGLGDRARDHTRQSARDTGMKTVCARRAGPGPIICVYFYVRIFVVVMLCLHGYY